MNNALEVKIFSRMFSEEITFIFNYCLDVQEKNRRVFLGRGSIKNKNLETFPTRRFNKQSTPSCQGPIFIMGALLAAATTEILQNATKQSYDSSGTMKADTETISPPKP